MPEVLVPKPEVAPAVAPEVLVAVPVPLSPTLTKYRKVLLFAAPVLAVVLSWGSAVLLHAALTAGTTGAAVADRGPPDGAQLFSQHCARCHGERGDGHGLVPLDPPARHFGAEKFKLATTVNSVGRVVPCDDDLLRVLKHGIPGSAMPAFDQLPEGELRAIAGHVRRLAWENVFAMLRAKEVKEFGDYDPLDIAKRTEDLTCLGKPPEVPTSFAAANPQLLARGHDLYMQNCAPCHGPEGRGDGPQTKDPSFKNENGTPAHPRDLTQGLYKGGGEPAQLYARIVLGIPGTPMPATKTLSPQDVDALIAYIRSLPQHPQTGAAVAER
jgi:mono/diheme cytochrome c family protein